MADLKKINTSSLKEIATFREKTKDIGDFDKRTAKTTDAIEDLPLLHESLNNFFKPSAGYNDGYNTKADNFKPDARERYIKADMVYYAKTQQNMQIHSGTRTVLRQAQLYILHTWHDQGNRAAWPGCSFHNWGLAADMIRTDEANIIDAMKRSGWTRTVTGEGWHFECTGSNDHSKAKKEIASFRKRETGLAYRWSAEVANFYIKGRDFNERDPVFHQRLETHKQVGQALKADIEQFKQAVTSLNERGDEYNKDLKHFNSEVERARQLYDEIMAMEDGPERDQKIREYNLLVAWLEGEDTRLNNEFAELERERDRLEEKDTALYQRVTAYDKEKAWLAQEHDALAKLRREVPEHETTADRLLEDIKRAVG